MLFIWILKLFGNLSRFLGIGAGSTWPGHIMLGVHPSFLREFDKKFTGTVIVIAGTNGKTTTSKIIRTILESTGKRVIHNESGANLLNGIASSIVLHSNILSTKKFDFAVFEIDENSLPLLLDELTPDILVILNLFRDQLDRYGEVNTIALKWREALEKLPKATTRILNANDPEIAFLGRDKNISVKYFGLVNKMLYLMKKPHAMDATSCPNCGKQLIFEGVYLGHLGNWKCSNCFFKEPEIDYSMEDSVLPGLYNIYNTQAAALIAKTLGIDAKTTENVFQNFSPAFGRQEESVVDGKLVKIFLSKNPTGFNESLRTVCELNAKYLLLVLNDRIPDGRDVSWIWDVDFEEFIDNTMKVSVGGDRCFDLALRLKYAEVRLEVHFDLHEAMKESLKHVESGETLYILPTYSAMLEVRKILGGRKIL